MGKFIGHLTIPTLSVPSTAQLSSQSALSFHATAGTYARCPSASAADQPYQNMLNVRPMKDLIGLLALNGRLGEEGEEETLVTGEPECDA
ncbi:hypothetical protein FOVSG1_003711 [Fusarium oxysporum f. sp. vasinfectum]